MKLPYDAMAPLYSAWTATAPVCRANAEFYSDLYVVAAKRGLVVELGVGDGRIAVEAARRGARVLGVDNSSGMLELCRQRATRAESEQNLELQQADFREFVTPEPASLIAIPFHTIGHLLTLDDKRDALRHIFGQLAPGGLFVFDHFVMDAAYARAKGGHTNWRASFEHPTSKLRTHLFETSNYNFDTKVIQVLARADQIDGSGRVVHSDYVEIELSWIEPEVVRELLTEIGFEIASVHGGFDGEVFDEHSKAQVWTARRPG